MHTGEYNLLILFDEIITILNSFDESNWTITFKTFKKKLALAENNKELLIELSSDVLKIYGGLGSFSDLILYDIKGKLARDETAQLDQLRTKLFEVALSIKSA